MGILREGNSDGSLLVGVGGGRKWRSGRRAGWYGFFSVLGATTTVRVCRQPPTSMAPQMAPIHKSFTQPFVLEEEWRRRGRRRVDRVVVVA